MWENSISKYLRRHLNRSWSEANWYVYLTCVMKMKKERMKKRKEPKSLILEKIVSCFERLLNLMLEELSKFLGGICGAPFSPSRWHLPRLHGGI